jgi:hypothetical protein
LAVIFYILHSLVTINPHLFCPHRQRISHEEYISYHDMSSVLSHVSALWLDLVMNRSTTEYWEGGRQQREKRFFPKAGLKVESPLSGDLDVFGSL